MFDPADPDPDYALVWPRELFRSEATAVLGLREAPDWVDRADLLLAEAFAGRGPVDDLEEASQNLSRDWLLDPGWLGPGSQAVSDAEEAARYFLRRLVALTDALPEHVTPRPYWSARRRQPPPGPTTESANVEAAKADWLAEMAALNARGYLEREVGPDCPARVGPSIDAMLDRELASRLHVADLWPLRPATWDEDTFYSLIEAVHDMVARPRRRWWHEHEVVHPHHDRFAVAPGRALYRWRVDRLLARHGISLRLAATGEDAGRLVRRAGDHRDELADRVAAVEAEWDTRQHAIALFRDRGAGVPEKRSAIVALAGLLEDRRSLLKTELLSKDEGALFTIANQYDLRHRRADQHGDYVEAYLDWVFWWYLATLDLTDQLLDRQSDGSDAASR